MNKYHKIRNVYKRDPDNNYKTLIEGEFDRLEFEVLKDAEWYFTEKIDGTSMRVIWEDGKLIFKGRREKSQIPADLVNRLREIFDEETFKEKFDTAICLYGEGYGDGIEGAGYDYEMDGVDFILFDVKIGSNWLDREDVEDIAEALGIDVVPVLGEGTLEDGIEMAKKGFKSTINGVQAEGIIARPKVELMNKNGERVITKIKYEDFN